jgi:hypothetical protein
VLCYCQTVDDFRGVLTRMRDAMIPPTTHQIGRRRRKPWGISVMFSSFLYLVVNNKFVLDFVGFVVDLRLNGVFRPCK